MAITIVPDTTPAVRTLRHNNSSSKNEEPTSCNHQQGSNSPVNRGGCSNSPSGKKRNIANRFRTPQDPRHTLFQKKASRDEGEVSRQSSLQAKSRSNNDEQGNVVQTGGSQLTKHEVLKKESIEVVASSSSDNNAASHGILASPIKWLQENAQKRSEARIEKLTHVLVERDEYVVEQNRERRLNRINKRVATRSTPVRNTFFPTLQKVYEESSDAKFYQEDATRPSVAQEARWLSVHTASARRARLFSIFNNSRKYSTAPCFLPLRQ